MELPERPTPGERSGIFVGVLFSLAEGVPMTPVSVPTVGAGLDARSCTLGIEVVANSAIVDWKSPDELLGLRIVDVSEVAGVECNVLGGG